MRFYVAFKRPRSHRDETENRNLEEVPLSSRIVPRGLSEGPETALHNAAHSYSDKANPLRDPVQTQTCELRLGGQASKH